MIYISIEKTFGNYIYDFHISLSQKFLSVISDRIVNYLFNRFCFTFSFSSSSCMPIILILLFLMESDYSCRVLSFFMFKSLSSLCIISRFYLHYHLFFPSFGQLYFLCSQVHSWLPLLSSSTEFVLFFYKVLALAGLVQCWSTGLRTEGFRFDSQSRTWTSVEGYIFSLCQGTCRRQPIDVSLSYWCFSFSRPSSLHFILFLKNGKYPNVSIKNKNK